MSYRYPSKHDEAWRRTGPESFKWPNGSGDPSIDSFDRGSGYHRNVHLLTLEEGMKRFPLVVKTAGKMSFPNDFSRLIEERAGEGYVLFIERPVMLDRPVSIAVKLSPGSGLIRNVIYVAPASTLTIIEDIEDTGGEQLLFSTGIVLGAGARVDYRRHWRWNRRVYGSLEAVLGEKSRLRVSVYHRNPSLSKIEQYFYLKERESTVDGLFVSVGESEAHLDYLCRVVHSAADTSSNLEARSVLEGKSYGVHHGLIEIRRNARGSKSYFSSRNLLLSERARADSIPKLEIATDEVSAGHGATVSTVDPDAVFYMMTRGLRRSEAKRTFIEGFLAPMYKRMPELVEKEESRVA